MEKLVKILNEENEEIIEIVKDLIAINKKFVKEYKKSLFSCLNVGEWVENEFATYCDLAFELSLLNSNFEDMGELPRPTRKIMAKIFDLILLTESNYSSDKIEKLFDYEEE